MTYWIAAYVLAGGFTLLIASRWFGWLPGTSAAYKAVARVLMLSLWPALWVLLALSGLGLI